MPLALPGLIAALSLAVPDAPRVDHAVLTPDGETLLVAVDFPLPAIVEFDAATGKARGLTELHSAARRLALDSTGETIALLGRDREVRIGRRDAPQEWASWTLGRDSASVNRYKQSSRSYWGITLEFSPDGERLLVAIPGYDVSLLDRSGALIATMNGPCDTYCQRAHWWSSDGHILVARWGAIEVRNGTTGEFLRSIDTHDAIESIAPHPSLPRVATGHHGGHVRVWDLETGDARNEYGHKDPLWGPAPTSAEPQDEFPRIAWLTYSPDGAWLAYTTAASVHLGVIDTATFASVGLSPFLGGASGNPAKIVWSADSATAWACPTFSLDVQFARIHDSDLEEPSLEHGEIECGGDLLGPTHAGRAALLTVLGGEGFKSIGVLDLDEAKPLWRHDALAIIAQLADLVSD